MSGICQTTAEITSPALLGQLYPDSILPAKGIDRTADGRLRDVTLQTMYSTLENDGKLVTLDKYKQSLKSIKDGQRLHTKQILENLGQNEKKTMDAIRDEFCFNYVRYKYSLEDLFNYLVKTSTGNTLTVEQRNEIKRKLNTARDYNTKLNDLIQFTNYIATRRAAEMRQQNDEINMLNDDISKTFGTLAAHNKILKDENAETLLRKRMVDFTQEKNLSANNLLSLYGFLNLVALGLLFYISRT